MTRRLHHAITLLILLAGIIWSLPLESGRPGTHLEPAAYSAADPAEFRVTSYRSTLAIAGHARSKHHEQRVADAATRDFSSYSTNIEFRPLGVAPAWWDDATIELVTLLGTLESGSAYLTEDALHIGALAPDPPAVDQRLRALRDVLPASTDIDVQLTAVDRSKKADTFCRQQFAAFKAGPVAFEESGTQMRASAYPVLDRVVALADACRTAMVTITGHTDSTGNESWNRQLSVDRAKTVAADLDSRGIAADRLDVVGSGSSVPVADNATRYGRSINRRIEIRFTARSD